MSQIWDMLRAMKKGAAASPPIVDVMEHDRDHHRPSVPLPSPENFKSTTSLSTSPLPVAGVGIPNYHFECLTHDKRTS